MSGLSFLLFVIRIGGFVLLKICQVGLLMRNENCEVSGKSGSGNVYIATEKWGPQDR